MNTLSSQACTKLVGFPSFPTVALPSSCAVYCSAIKLLTLRDMLEPATVTATATVIVIATATMFQHHNTYPKHTLSAPCIEYGLLLPLFIGQER